VCRIAGIVGPMPGRSVVLTDTLEKIRHRGPDGHGVFDGNAVSLAYARLSIVDLSDVAAQLMHDPETGNVITYNGEIYIYSFVAREIAPAPAGMGTGDTATLLRAYGKYGEDVVT